MKRIIMSVTIVALTGLTWAIDDAVVAPNQGVTVRAITNNITAATDAITIPRMLSYQGRLTDSLGNPVPDGNYQMTFRLYPDETGGTPFWSEAKTITVRNGLFSALLGEVTPINAVPDNGEMWLGLQVASAPELTPRLRIVSSAFSFLSERSANSDLLQGRDTSYFARANHTHPYVDSAGGAQRVGGYNITGLDGRYVNENQANSITSGMITDGTIVQADVAGNFKAPYSDTADYARLAPASDSARVAANSHFLQGKDTTAFASAFQIGRSFGLENNSYVDTLFKMASAGWYVVDDGDNDEDHTLIIKTDGTIPYIEYTLWYGDTVIHGEASVSQPDTITFPHYLGFQLTLARHQYIAHLICNENDGWVSCVYIKSNP